MTTTTSRSQETHGLFRGLIAYPITPLTVEDTPHLAGVASLVNGVVSAGLDGVAVLATSGAGVTFDRNERRAVVESAVEAAGPSGTPVYVAVSTASTRETIALARDAEAAGAAGLLLTPFGYLPLATSDVHSLFQEVSSASSLPICFYNKPAQMQYDISPETLNDLVNTAHVIGIKETTARDDLQARLASLRSAAGPGTAIGLSGEIALMRDRPLADAWHSGLAALLPTQFKEIWEERTCSDPQSKALNHLRKLGDGMSQIPWGLGALHALATLLDTETTSPRGPYAPASAQDIAVLQNSLHIDALPKKVGNTLGRIGRCSGASLANPLG